VKSATDKLVPASMVQNEPVFKLHRDVVDTMISGAGGFAAILHRHRSADRFRRTVLVLASCVDGTPPQSAIGAASNTGRNSPRHVVDACHKLLFAIGAHKNGASGRTSRNFAGGVIVLAAPHSSSFWIHGRQIVDAGNSLATRTNRATGIVMQQRIDDVANGSLKLLFAVGTDKPCHFVVACRYLIWRASVFAAPHVGCLVAKSLIPETTFKPRQTGQPVR